MSDSNQFLKHISELSKNVLNNLKLNPKVGKYIDDTLPIPEPFVGSGKIKLIVLGQDPTVGNRQTRNRITQALMLNNGGTLKTFLHSIGETLGIELEENVYATNLCKNFFIEPPTKIKDVNLVGETGPVWLSVLHEELAEYPDAPVLGLGEPILDVILRKDAYQSMKWFLGYDPNRSIDEPVIFRRIPTEATTIGRAFFPLIHLNSQGHKFYKARFNDYLAFIRQEMIREVK